MRHTAQTAALAVSLVLVLTVTVLAQDTTVTLPWGNWLDAILGQIIMIAGTVATVIVAFALKFVPATLKAYVDEQRIRQVEQLLQNAIGYGLSAVQGAARGKTLDVNVGNEVVATAAQYAIDNGPGWLINWMGGTSGLRDKIVARLPVAENAALK